ncbi:MAG: 3-phosphoserine/phosphohydroxythreonine transaminase [Firmicutes bacterium]|nr:3-phosphoserine/phosphohydroxythreonine transaminase [Bacillota bacterium]
MEKRVYNYGAGPSTLPLEVLEKAQRDLLAYPGCGHSVMEMSHRTKAYMEIHNRAKNAIKRLMNVPDGYEVLLLQGGASGQFSMVPMNLARRGDKVDYANTGYFAKLAIKEAKRWADPEFICTSEDKNFTYIPKITPDMLRPDTKYLHITGNKTIEGTAYHTLPDCGDVPLVADWSSSIMGQQIDVAKHALIYAGAQKNMGIAGLTVVIVKKDAVIDPADPMVPDIMNYNVQIAQDSLHHTPSGWAVYMAALMCEWIEAQGGVAAMEALNRKKSGMVYDVIDKSDLYINDIPKEDRSLVNVTAKLPSQELTDRFAKEAEAEGMINVKGHRSVGGLRISLYNGAPLENAEKIADFMQRFEKNL